MKYFEEVEKRLIAKLGASKAEEMISNAVYLISMGSNDYLGGYLGNPKMQELYNPQLYVGIVLGNLTSTIQVSSKYIYIYLFICIFILFG